MRRDAILIRALATLVWMAAVAPPAARAESRADPAAARAYRLRLWEMVLGSRQQQGAPVEPRPAVTWETDLGRALRTAREEGRPLFVTMRCLPCKQCADFDKDVLEGGPALDPLLRQFVTVRLTDANAIDLRLLPVDGFQDLDLSWWGWFLSPQGQVYGVFGGRDHVSDSTRISVPALAATMRRILDHHYNPARRSWSIDGQAPVLEGGVASSKSLPGYASWYEKAGAEVKAQACLHCHQVREVLWQPAVDAGRFDKARDFDVWPLPENVGITVDRDHGLRVTWVEADSPAERAGLQPGDVLGAAGSRRLFSQADFRGVLHRGPRGAGEIEVHWLRDGKVLGGTLQVQDGWRKTVLDWRMSVSQGNVGAGPSFFPIPVDRDRRRQRGIGDKAMAVEPYLGPKPAGSAYDAGLRGDDVITAVNGQAPDLAGRAFLVWFRTRFDPGDEVTLTVRNPTGEERQVRYRVTRRG